MPSNPLKPANAKAKRRAWHRQRSGSRSGRLSGIKSARSPEDTCATSYEFSSDCNLSYSYDANGRRTAIGDSYAQSDLPAAISTATHNAANQLTKWGSATLSYDANGNLLSDGSLAHSWNARNQLASLSGAAVASFQYDALGRRIGKTVAGTATGFLYDGINPVQELTGSSPKANLLTGLGVDEIFSRTDASGARHLLTDALGSTLALTDGTGAVQTRYSYEPYGKTTVSGTASSNSFEYTGRENDSTGLYFYRARYYNPGLQRFVSEDPIGLAGGVNQYGYVDGDPLSFIDPLGLVASSDPWFGYGGDQGFKDWWHGEKQKYGGVDIPNKGACDDLYKDYQDSKERGKGGKSGKGGRSKGDPRPNINDLIRNGGRGGYGRGGSEE